MEIAEQQLYTKRIFNRDIAMGLVSKGFKVIGTEPHKDNPNWIIFHFNYSKELQDAFTIITNEIRVSKLNK
jgi:hypothetical protein